MRARTKDLIAELREYQDIGRHLTHKAADALERPTQPVGVEPVAWEHDSPTRYDVIHTKVKSLLMRAQGHLHRPLDTVEHYTVPLYSAATVARLQVEREEWKHEAMYGGHTDQLRKERDALQEQVKMLRDALKLADLRYSHPDNKEALAATEPKEKAE